MNQQSSSHDIIKRKEKGGGIEGERDGRKGNEEK